MRSDGDVRRGAPLTLLVDGQAVAAFEGETIATALLACDLLAFRLDRGGRPRGLFCNMGVCGECLVTVAGGSASPRRLRACLTPAADGMIVTTRPDERR